MSIARVKESAAPKGVVGDSYSRRYERSAVAVTAPASDPGQAEESVFRWLERSS
jgi:hypothetical protein